MSGEVDTRTTDQIVAEVCAALSVERVEIRPAPTETTQQIVRTAPFTYSGNDRLDMWPGTSDPIGAWFAPSREIAGTLWRWFEPNYIAEMRASFGIVPGSEHFLSLNERDQGAVLSALAREGIAPNPAAWDALLARREVTLVCVCADTTRCHRTLLARILERLGARYLGETS